MGRRNDRGDAGRAGHGCGVEPDEGVATDPRRGDRVERVAAASGVAGAARQGPDHRTRAGGRGMRRALVAAMAALTIVGAPPAPSLHAAPVASQIRASGTIRRPPVRWKAIPFGAKRKREMAAYSKRHYGKRTWHVRQPQVIAQRSTDG